MRRISWFGVIVILLAAYPHPRISVVRAAPDCSFSTVATTMTLAADCTTDATILVPNGFTLDGGGHTITAADPSAGHFLGAVVMNSGAEAYVTNLTVKASGLANVCDGGGPPDNRLRGILFVGAGGSITNNTVDDINQGLLSGCQEGNGIEVRNAPFDGTHPSTKTVIIKGNTVTDYQKNGITANGDVFVAITNNTVTGAGSTDYIAQNGIQLGYGATGEVKQNSVSGNWYGLASWVAAGILIFEADEVLVQKNIVAGSQVGVAVETWCWLAPSASENGIVQNRLSGSEIGIAMQSIAWAYSTCDPTASNNKAVNNIITGADPEGDIGILIGAFDESISYTAFAAGNKVINNSINGFDESISDAGAATKIHANVSAP
jgi:hypothetical protein